MGHPVEVVCSAPGKVILFGEHAVVYGTTAIAASLSDCRMMCRVSWTEESLLDIHLLDFIESGVVSPIRIDCSSLRDMLPPLPGMSPTTPLNPSEKHLETMKSRIQFPSASIGDGVYAICFLVANIFPELLHPDHLLGGPRSGLRVQVKSIQLPIGAGLGSSAAFSVALSGALLRLRATSLEDVPQFAEMTTDFTSSAYSPSQEILDIINKWAYGNLLLLLVY